MRVLHLLDVSAPTIAGYASRSRAIVNAQRAIGLEPVVLTSVRHKSRNGAALEEIDGIRHYRTLRPVVPGRQPLTEMACFRQRILEVARIERAQLLHAHSPILTGLPSWLAARQLGVGCVYEIRSLWEDAAVERGDISEQSLRYRLTRGAETFLTRRVDAVVLICEGLRRELGGRGLPAERLYVVPNGVDITRFVPRASDDATRARLGLQGRTVVGYIGTFFGFEGVADLVEARRREGKGSPDEIEARRARLTAKSAANLVEAQSTARDKAGERPLHLATVAQELWDVVKDTDWVVGNGDLRGWLERLWDFNSPHQGQDTRGGAGLGQGLPHAIGVALANRDKGRLTINIQSDGDLLFTPSAIWTAVHHRIPLLIVMYNNRTYGNDLGHQGMMARVRGRPEENKTIGIDINDPVVDFVGLARSFGAWAEGPIERAEDLRPAFERAKREVVENGRVALVDLYTQVT